MKKIILFGLCVSWAAAVFGQNLIGRYEYWIDDNADARVSVVLATPVATATIDADLPLNALSLGLHTLNIRFQDTSGRWSVATSRFFERRESLTPTVSVSRKINLLQYWTDGDIANSIQIADFPADSLVNIDKMLPLSNLALGLHTLTYRFKDDSGLWSVPNSQFFERRESLTPTVSVSRKINLLQYWTDGDVANSVQIADFPADSLVNIDKMLPLSNLALGLHTLTYRFKDDGGLWSVPNTQFFERRESLTPTASVSRKINLLQYWTDGDVANSVQIADFPVDSLVNIDKMLPLSNLALGLHTLTYRFKDDGGLWSVPNTQFFERRELVKTSSDTFRNKVYAFESWIDTSFSSRTQSIRFQADTLVNLDTLLPLSHLALGLHTLNYRFKDSLNQWSSVMTQFFERRENNVIARVNRITAFEYWIGTQFAQRVTVAVPPDSVLSLDVNRFIPNLTTGVNVFSWRFKDSSGLWSAVVRDTLSVVIPIELLSFDAQLFGQDAHLKWTTASEKNVSTFDIERSTDGINFKAIGEVKAVGNSQTLQKYRFVDKNLRSSQRIYYYRLRIVDRDGTSDYSPIRSVELDTKSPTLTVYPNPTSGSLTVDIQNPKIHAMELVNVLGQSVMKTTLNQEKTDLDLSDLQAGIYFIRVAIIVDKIVVQKIIKQ